MLKSFSYCTFFAEPSQYMTDRYAVIGNPISHSKSPYIHTAFAKQTKQKLIYEALLVEPNEFTETVVAFEEAKGKGLNITVPFKQHAWEIANELSDRATLARAVNTLKFEGGIILGDNTDGAGFMRDLEVNLGFSVSGKKVCLLGAGGAARGILAPLLAAHPTQLIIANRTLEKVRELQHQFLRVGHIDLCEYADLEGASFDLIINATSSSLSHELPPLPPNVFAANALAYDLMYGSYDTPFLNYAKDQGASVIADGTGMLVEQAAESFFLWRGVRPETKALIAELKN